MTSRIEIKITERVPFAGGHEFGDTGAYERLKGRVHYAVDPNAPAQAVVVDIDKAPVNGDGLVEFSGDFLLIRPVDLARGNKRVFFDYGNRGRHRALQFFNDGGPTNDPLTLDHAGNGFLFRRGYSFWWGAWQGDLLSGQGRTTLDLPVATDNGKPITGLVRTEIITERTGVKTVPLSGRAATRSHPTVSMDPADASFTKRRYPADDPMPVPPEEWCFAQWDVLGSEEGLVPSDRHLHYPAGFEPGWIYELVYTGRDPLVNGLGHVAVRNLISFLKYDDKDSAGNPNPIAPCEKAYGFGRSQTGRAIRDFIHWGFNEDEKGRRAFDGVIPHVAGSGRHWMNQRFSDVTMGGGAQYIRHTYFSTHFPFAYAVSTDHNTGETDGIMKRPDTDPLVIHTFTATEYWQRRGSLAHTDTEGNDLPIPENVRIYMWAGSQHFANPRMGEPGTKTGALNMTNNVYTSLFFRAHMDALDRWATDGTPPPESRIPTRADGTLGTYDEWREKFPDIPGLMLPKEPASMPLLDFGPDEKKGIFTKLPPETVKKNAYAVQIPLTDADGNDLAGLLAPMVAAPLATYTGWNMRARGHAYGLLYRTEGSYVPFPETPQEREWSNDPRASILERYATAEDYVAAIVSAAENLAEEGYILEEDIARVKEMAENWGRPRHIIHL
jgi:hypothetical protein